MQSLVRSESDVIQPGEGGGPEEKGLVSFFFLNMEEGAEEGRSLAETPTYALASVVTFMVAVGFFFHSSLRWTAKWLDRTKRKSLLAALRKIKEELMLFGLLSLLMGHWIESAAKICIKSSVSSRFYPCPRKNEYMSSMKHIALHYSNSSVSRDQRAIADHRSFCPEGHESFASYESLEQIHRLLLVLAVIHVSYSLGTLALAMIKIHSWIKWENQAKAMAIQDSQGCTTREASGNIRIMRLSTFIFHHTSHPWNQHKVLVWLLSFIRQFWSSINRPDYMALRLGFITAHELPLSYDFHNYMLRSMEEEFRDIVGISIPLWIYAIVCIFLDFHGSNIYFWISFLPSMLILLIGTKLHRIIVKLAVEIMGSCPAGGPQFRLRDGLFWLGRPRLLLWLMQFISFQNAFEMATFIWSLWEIRGTSCFMDNRSLLVIRLVFGVVSQFWCSYITFPLYVIVTQMGSSFKKTVISESMRCLLQGWQRRAKRKQHGSSTPLLTAMSVTSLDSLVDGDDIERLSDSPAHHVHDIESLSSSVHEDISFAPGESMESEEEDHDLQLEVEDSGSRVHGYPVFDGHDSELGESVCDEFL